MAKLNFLFLSLTADGTGKGLYKSIVNLKFAITRKKLAVSFENL